MRFFYSQVQQYGYVEMNVKTSVIKIKFAVQRQTQGPRTSIARITLIENLILSKAISIYFYVSFTSVVTR